MTYDDLKTVFTRFGDNELSRGELICAIGYWQMKETPFLLAELPKHNYLVKIIIAQPDAEPDMLSRLRL